MQNPKHTALAVVNLAVVAASGVYIIYGAAIWMSYLYGITRNYLASARACHMYSTVQV